MKFRLTPLVMFLALGAMMMPSTALAEDATDVPPPPDVSTVRPLSPLNGAKIRSRWMMDMEDDDGYTAYAPIRYRVKAPRGLSDDASFDALYLEVSTTPDVDEDGLFVDPIEFDGEDSLTSFTESFPGRYRSDLAYYAPGRYYWHPIVSYDCDSPDVADCSLESGRTYSFTVYRPRKPKPDFIW